MAYRVLNPKLTAPLTGAVLLVLSLTAQAELNQGSYELLDRKIRLLEKDNARLRDDLDRAKRDLKFLKSRLDSMYGDIDFRLSELEERMDASAVSSEAGQAKPQPEAEPPALATGDKGTEPAQSIQQQYDVAKSAYDLSAYTEASKGFVKVAKGGGNSPLVWSAHFWLGQIALKQGKEAIAREHFSLIVKQAAPGHNKRPLAQAWLDKHPTP